MLYIMIGLGKRGSNGVGAKRRCAPQIPKTHILILFYNYIDIIRIIRLIGTHKITQWCAPRSPWNIPDPPPRVGVGGIIYPVHVFYLFSFEI